MSGAAVMGWTLAAEQSVKNCESLLRFAAAAANTELLPVAAP